VRPLEPVVRRIDRKGQALALRARHRNDGLPPQHAAHHLLRVRVRHAGDQRHCEKQPGPMKSNHRHTVQGSRSVTIAGSSCDRTVLPRELPHRPGEATLTFGWRPMPVNVPPPGVRTMAEGIIRPYPPQRDSATWAASRSRSSTNSSPTSGHHSRAKLRDLKEVGFRPYISEPYRPPQRWRNQLAERDAVYANRRRIHGARGQRLLRRRGELLERPAAHPSETGSVRRTHLRGHNDIRKGLLVHAAASSLGLWCARPSGVNTPRSLQGRAPSVAILSGWWRLTLDTIIGIGVRQRAFSCDREDRGVPRCRASVRARACSRPY